MDLCFPETSSGVVEMTMTTANDPYNSTSHAGMTSDTFAMTSSVDQPILSSTLTRSHFHTHTQNDTPPRKRTRATPDQLTILEKTFNMNPSPNNRVREQLARQLGMSERSIQIWFQNRRAKVKNMAKRSTQLHDETLRLQQYAAAAASAACQAAAYTQQQMSPDGNVVTNPDLYNYYYYYYYNQQQQFLKQEGMITMHSLPRQGPSVLPPPPPPPPVPLELLSLKAPNSLAEVLPSWPTAGSPSGGRMRAHTVSTYPSYYPYQRNNMTNHAQDPNTPTDKTKLGNNGALAFHDGARKHRSYSSASPTPQLGWTQATAVQTNSFDSAEREDNFFCSSDYTSESPVWQTGIGISPSLARPSGQAAIPFDSGKSVDMKQQHNLGMDNKGKNNLSYRMISAETLQIGTWKRINLRVGDLECGYESLHCTFIWCIRDGQQRFKMEFNLSSIQRIHLHPLAERQGWARLELYLAQPNITFYLESAKTGTWTQCGDYTQDKQASTIIRHQLDGPALALRGELTRIAQENSRVQSLFQNDAIQPSVPTVTSLHVTPSFESHPHHQHVFVNANRLTSVPTDAALLVQERDDRSSVDNDVHMEGDKNHSGEPSMLALMEKDPPQDLLLFQSINP